MIKELWNSFPRLLEQKINALLDEAEPSPTKAFQLYKTCQSENLWQDTFEKFSERLGAFFSLPRHERRKSFLDSLLERPVSALVFDDFHLTFRNSMVDNRSVLTIASWAHNLMRVRCKTEAVVISPDVLHKTLTYITHPPTFEKEQNITFDDFCSAWKKTVFKLFGKKYDQELNEILKELQWLNIQLKKAEKDPQEHSYFFPSIYLTQTEIDWTTAVQDAVMQNLAAPKFPLSRGPQKQRLIDLERAVSLYKIVQTTKLPELIKQRDNIRTTILYQCEKLLQERAR
ncbi:hypothetical protein D3C87_339480 [compost metagenome]